MLRKCGLGLALVSALALTSASQALADGMPGGSLKDEPVAAPEVYDWTGFGVGLGIGASTFNPDISADGWKKKLKRYCEPIISIMDTAMVNGYQQYYCNDYYSTGYKHLDTESSGDDWDWFGTIQVSYDRLIHDHVLIGAFADFDFYRDSEHSFYEGLYYGDYHAGSLSGNVEREFIWSVGGRVGFLLRPRLLVYGLAAYSQMRLDGTLDVDFSKSYHYPSTPTLHVQLPKNLNGYSLGAGVEMKLEKRLSLKIEYRYMHFDGGSASASELTEGYVKCYDGCTQKAVKIGGKINLDDMDEHSVRAVLSWKLSRDEEHVPLK